MKHRILLFIAIGCLIGGCSRSGRTCFAVIADTHINLNVPGAGEELLTVIRDINTQDSIDFVILAGDITEFGSDREIREARRILDSLQKPWYILSGNHDSKWSESGCNTFVEIFDYEQFSFVHNNMVFIGTNSGPNMRMAPALVPRESIVWLDSLLQTIPKKMPVIFINHYPLTEDMSNYRQVIELLKTRNIQMTICGHYHTNEAFTAGGIPSFKCRSALSKGYEGPGYNLVTIEKGKVTFRERIALPDRISSYTQPPWHSFTFSKRRFFLTDSLKHSGTEPIDPQLEIIWSIQDDSDIGSAAMADSASKTVVFANTRGVIKAVTLDDGTPLWSTSTNGKIYSTPHIAGQRIYIGSTDRNVYCLDLHNGNIIWKYTTGKSIVASPAVMAGVVYIGGSDNTFRALDADNGQLLWEYTGINGFMESKPYVDPYQVVTGSWGNELYSFHPLTGKLQWIWENRHRGRMYSPAATWPVKAGGKIFITTPERKCYAIDARTGKTVWEAEGGRESIGLSDDKQQVYVKTMFDSLYAFHTVPGKALSKWRVAGGFGYEIGPSPVTSQDGLVFVPSAKGVLYAYDKDNGSARWHIRLSDGLINYAQPVGNSKLIVSTLDGQVYLIGYKNDVLQ
ncbi:MAG: Outer membrane protein assembly factor BamB precursor [Bacteroidetes bacterium ADurb.Bin037]|nr:MAG: Outer membrane protein assembly factor BamB precursor [Bacteroidetes bacterium ADurb.Bin037]HPW77802.1 PQQ-binding-like beta-propeller repeat protein [Bacteroidales bacterium]HQB55629.1 PQQ-binding-like beta-propeller repeat protein [Bacteroidales bacterium]